MSDNGIISAWEAATEAQRLEFVAAFTVELFRFHYQLNGGERLPIPSDDYDHESRH